MADLIPVRISDLPEASDPVDDAALVIVVEDGVARQATVAEIGGQGPAGPQGEQGEPGSGVDPAAGDPGFTAGPPTGVELARLTLETDKHYSVAYHGINYNGTLTDGVRSRPFDISVCISTLTGSAVLQSPTVGTPQPTSGSGQIEFSVSGLDVIVTLYGGTADTEWFGKLEIVTEYDPAVQVADWEPLDEASCLFFFDPAVGVTLVGSDVSVWSGQVGSVSASASANRPDFQATDSALNNQPVVNFTGANSERMLVTGLSHVAADYSFFAVLNQGTLDADSYLFDAQTGRLILSPDRSSTAIAYNDGSFRTAPGAAQTGAHYIAWIPQAPDVGEIRKNGVSLEDDLVYVQRALGGTTRIGSNFSAGGSFLNAAVGAFFGFASVDPGIRFRSEKYMQARFAL